MPLQEPLYTHKDEIFIDLCREYIEQLKDFRQRWKKIIDRIQPSLQQPEETGQNVKNLAEIPHAVSELKNIYHDFMSNVGTDFETTLTKTPWQNWSHFAHNIGPTGIQTLTLQIEYFLESGENFEETKIYLENLTYFIDQIICHIQSALLYLKDKTGKENPKSSESNTVIEALQTALRARLFYSDLAIPEVSNIYREKAAKATILGSSEIKSQIPLEQLTEIAYVPISNAHRIMNQHSHPEDLRLEVIAREIRYRKERLLILEFFNTGKTVDLAALQEKLLEIPEAKIAVISPDLIPVIRAIKKGSRQAKLATQEEMLIIDGLTMTSGGTGIGLSDLHRQLKLQNGTLLLNNVYHPEKGFCVTIILPQRENANPSRIIKILRKLKEELQTGKYFLEKTEAMAA